MAVGQRIRERLKARGMSQAELARRVGVDQSTINALINGHSRGSRYMHSIARELLTSPEFLEGQTDDSDPGAIPNYDLDAQERTLLAQVRELDPVDRNAIFRIVGALVNQVARPTIHDRQLEYHAEG